jgi:DNA polymerase (family 10)
VEAAARSGLAYVGLTDHSLGLPGWGRTGPELVAHRAKVLELADRKAKKVKVFVGVEANITREGGLDLPAKYLDELDYVVASVHTHFQMDAAEMTKRLVKALGDGGIHVLSHPTGRKIGERPGLAFDADAVFEAAAESGTALELNAQPDRLDLNGELARRAREWGCRFAVDSDGHGAPRRELLRWGVEQARRAWLGPGDVLNALPAAEVLEALRGRRRDAPARRAGGSRRSASRSS